MKTRLGEIEILGKKYYLNYSVRASRKFGEIEKPKKDETFQDYWERYIKYLAILLKEGADYAESILGEHVERRFTEEELLLLISPADCSEMIEAVNTAFERGNNREVDVKPGKNVESAAEGTKAG